MRFIIFVFLVLLVCDCFGGESIVASSLEIPAGVRGAGLYGAATAVSEGAEAIYFNPAAIYKLNSHQLLTAHSPWFGGEIYHTSISYAHKLSQNSAVAIGVWGVHAWSIESWNIYTDTIEDYYNSSEITVAYGYAHKRQATAVGITGKATFANVDREHAHVVTLDLGLLREFSPLKVGLCIQHLGVLGMKFADKRYLRAPTAKLAVSFPYTNFLFNAEVIFLTEAGEIDMRCSTEYTVNDYLKLRGGIGYDDNKNSLGGAIGCSLKLTETFLCDYAFSSYKLGAAHRFSLLTHIRVKEK